MGPGWDRDGSRPLFTPLPARAAGFIPPSRSTSQTVRSVAYRPASGDTVPAGPDITFDSRLAARE
jgi:hypothetical protein